ncbi:hypothetical protein ACLQ9Q_14730, partial [Bordetella avium]|uniref:hypothetical protein n=1 Tax=Bordetella avium TaxID=521 RepID=UPI0039FD4661
MLARDAARIECEGGQAARLRDAGRSPAVAAVMIAGCLQGPGDQLAPDVYRGARARRRDGR